MGLFTKLFGTRSQREIKHIQPLVDKILALEEEYRNLTNLYYFIDKRNYLFNYKLQNESVLC